MAWITQTVLLALVNLQAAIGTDKLPELPTFSCSPTSDVCETSLVIKERLTMYLGRELVYPHRGQLYLNSVTDPDNATPVDPNKVVVADGYYQNPRYVLAVNGSVPGPTIEVYEHQTLIVHVKNKLHNQDVSVHWHGLHMTNTPWMDGVPYVTQCPIIPHTSFTYKFKAFPAGTHWYHSHVSNQRTNGVFGALIVKRKIPRPIDLLKDHVVTLIDWSHDFDSDIGFHKMDLNMFEGKTKIFPSKAPHGGFYSIHNLQSGVMNGYGRFYQKDGSHNESPLYKFRVAPNTEQRFRVLNAGNVYPFRVSVDDHTITVVSTDGNDVEPYEAESVVINTGERFDFTIKTNNPIGTYWIRARPVANDKPREIAQGIIVYDGADPKTEPTTNATKCTQFSPCIVLNCPFRQWADQKGIRCVPVDDLRSIPDEEAEQTNEEMKNAPTRQLFLNPAFPGTAKWTPGSINGKALELPPVSALTQWNEVTNVCRDEECPPDDLCKCLHVERVGHKEAVYVTLTNLGSGTGWDHPMHLHGQRFEVLKVGFPDHDNQTGMLSSPNVDVQCDSPYCTRATWANASWSTHNIPGIVTRNPVFKDTVNVPTGGYTLIRFFTKNPGLWNFHCHIELHNGGGMALLIDSAKEKAPSAPKGFPRCGDFVLSSAPSDYKNMKGPTSTAEEDDGTEAKGGISWTTFGVVVTVLSVATVALLCAVIYLVLDRRGRENQAIKMTKMEKVEKEALRM